MDRHIPRRQPAGCPGSLGNSILIRCQLIWQSKTKQAGVIRSAGKVPSRLASRAGNITGKIPIIPKQIQFEAETAGKGQIDAGIRILVEWTVKYLGASLWSARDPLEIQI